MSGAESIASIYWLTPLVPLATFVVLACGLARFGRFAAWLATGSVAVATVLAAFGLFGATQGVRRVDAVPWLSAGGRSLSLALELTPLTALIALVVAVVGLVVLLYAVTYMAGDPRLGRFYTELSLLLGAMLTLVLAGDLITLFLAWELVGLCSYLLIGFWFARPGIPAAASKAFLTTRLADLGLLLGILLLVSATGTGRIEAVISAATSGRIAANVLLLAALLVVLGAVGKSAQLPFSGWLPDAMLGPAPISALLHSATMVAAGVFLVARLYPLLDATHLALGVVAWGGAITSLFAATIALVQTDIKRLLAYSTISQIGLMFVGLGAGSLLAGILLLVAHAFYKSTLFLGAGAVDHAVGGTDFARMGGLARRMPMTFVLFALAALALAGLPVTVALPAKDPSLAAAYASSVALFTIALLASLFTALYSARAVGLVFLGRPAEPARRAREARAGLRVPMLVLGILIVVVLVIDGPVAGRPLERLLGVSTPELAIVTVWALVLAGLGLLLGLLIRAVWPDRVAWPVIGWTAPLVASEYGLRPLYQGIARGGLLFARALAAVDRQVFDRIADLAAGSLLIFVRGLRRLDLRGVEGGIQAAARGILAVSQRARRVQTGMVGNYLLVIFYWGLGIVALAAIWLAVR
ncbi:MAG: NADH-quinone oxidoreductase subunit L [Ktedonobacterales bacterium]|nr:NADH-quinone oxidoreductase subunit L [Ktedonobacterales bacterium]